jgi:hypothetical protein
MLIDLWVIVLWDGKHKTQIFLNQSAMLYTTYYWTQIQVHRRFIPRPGQDSTIPFPSLTICTNAARSCIHIIESCIISLKQTRVLVPHFLVSDFSIEYILNASSHVLYRLIQVPLFSSAMILAVNLWRGKQVNPNYNPRFDLNDIYKCVELLRIWETRSGFLPSLSDTVELIYLLS